MRKKTLIGALAVVGAASVAASVLAPAPAPLTAAPQPQTQAAHNASNPVFVSLPVRQAMGPSHSNLFASQERPKQVPVVVAPPPATPAPPPMPYRIAGQVINDGSARVVLAKGERVFTVKQGDMLEDGYRVEKIDLNQVVLRYLPLDLAQYLPVTFALAPQAVEPSRQALARTPTDQAKIPSGPAQLRWLGPDRVFAGSPFEVVLKLTSAQPVGSAPVELRYDTKLLEPLSVRAGDFFADGKFSYRVAPRGAILIGATSRGAPAADVDFVVVTFKAIRPGATAELKVSSVELTDAAGGEIAHVPPVAFRTSIVR